MTDYRPTVFLPATDFPMKAGLPQKEPQILAKWQADGLYGQVRAARAGREKFILHDGPPYANGDMHIGHALNHILKDTVVRTQTLIGKDAPYVPGWDCHGLPIEWKIEEAYRAKKQNKDDVPAVEFRSQCRAYAQTWVDTQREQLKRLGINGNWDQPYLTMDFQAEATIVSELLKFAESGQLYRGAKPVMWSPVEKTALADAEVEYADVVSTQIDVAFEIVEAPNAPELVGAYAVIWTTTPWTIPMNQALAYGPEVEYALVEILALEEGGAVGRFLVASKLVDEFVERAGQNLAPVVGHRIAWAGHSSALAGAKALHPMANHFRHPREGGDPSPASADGSAMDTRLCGSDGEGGASSGTDNFYPRLRPFLPGDFVTTDTGTGLVHMAPDHGEDDFALCKAHGINPVFAVEGDGRYRADWLWLGGEAMNVINPKLNAPEGPICTALREAGALLSAADFKHSYPHSWRSKKKVIFRCTPQWFIPMDQPRDEGDTTLRQTAIDAIANTRFIPEKGRNRIGAMVEQRPDWVISRQRAWGVPITLFVDRKTGEYLVDPVINAGIVAAFRQKGVDAWTPELAAELLGDRVDDYEQITDILDVWFDSGCTHAFVLESGRWPELSWPADLYLEGSDQHRGWFQSSLLQSCGTRGRAPFDAVLTHGFTMDQSGRKMSKSEGNTVNPLKVMETHGADIIRLWALTVDFTEDHRIGDEILKGVSDQYRKLRNTFRYLLGALDGFSDAERVAPAQMPELERWVLHRLAQISAQLRAAIDAYDFNAYVSIISDFVNADLSAFAMDVRKDSLYCDAATDLRRRAWRTVLDIVFDALTRWLAPVLVFTAEEVWQMRFPGASVHLSDWPAIDAGWVDEALGARMAMLRTVREAAYLPLEAMRRDKAIGSFLEASITIETSDEDRFMALQGSDLAELLLVSEVHVVKGASDAVTAAKVDHAKCARCWRHLPDVNAESDLCGRCDTVLHG
ncbi:isoleucine--tRNA ligase [Sandarakinorhabdus sp.]|uniref:isoleucine--tRNA ligase n=1 Tax=Sandarakinorhabdus sp. TaxID=1916663 RepID=UPI00286DCC60|nr:isoleucine--tRNA ligase [Sandarakinorhabdus sp.]